MARALQWVVQAGQGSQVGLVTAVYCVTTIFNAIVTNNAAVSIFFPIALEVRSVIIIIIIIIITIIIIIIKSWMPHPGARGEGECDHPHPPPPQKGVSLLLYNDGVL